MSDDAAIITSVTADPQTMDSVAYFAVMQVALAIWVLLFLFFFSKFLGFFLSLILNVILSDAVNIRIGAIHIALLGGNITIRNLKYSSKNIIVRAVDVTLSMSWWREWSTCSTLLTIKASGLEFCIINSEARYTNLMDILSARTNPKQDQSFPAPLDEPPPPSGIFWLTRAIVFELSASSLMIGNSALKTMLVLGFARARGSVSLVEREHGCNRLQVDVNLYEVKARVKNNRMYETESGQAAGPSGLDRLAAMMRRQRRRIHEEWNRRIQTRLQFFSIHGQHPQGPEMEPEAQSDESEQKERDGEDDLLLSPLVHVLYYKDTAGYIDADNAYRSQPPMTGVVVDAAHSVLTYGPWEDRQRAAIQRWLLPADYVERKIHTPRTGYLAQPVAFHTKVNFLGSVVLRLPFSRDVTHRSQDYDSSRARNADKDCGPALLTIKAGEEPQMDGVAASKWGLLGSRHHVPDEFSDDSYTEDDEVEEDASTESQAGGSSDETIESTSGQESEQSSTDTWTSTTDWGSEISEFEEGSTCPWDLEEMELVGTVDVITPFLLESERYEIVTEVNLASQVTIASSIRSDSNSGILWECDKIDLNVTMGGGLKYNDLATTNWSIVVGDSTVRLLRDHTFLITSLISDWGWQPPPLNPQRLYFAPSHTVFKITLAENFRLGLLVNEDNVVDDFAADADNNVLWLQGSLLEIEFDTDRPHFRPRTSQTKFNIRVAKPEFDLFPRTSVNDFHAPLKNCIKADDLDVSGEITYCRHDANSGYRHADSSITSVTANGLHFAAHGVVIRAFLNFLDNYFGNSYHIITSAEYLASQNQNRKKRMETKERYQIMHARVPPPNAFHVQVRVVLSDVTLVLPNHLVVTCRRPPTARAHAHEVTVDVSSTPFQSDLAVSVTPISIKFPHPDKVAPLPPNGHTGTLYIDGVDYHDLSYNGPGPLYESYRTISRILVGEIRGSPTAMDIRMLSNFVSQLGEQGPRLIQELDGEVPRKWWARPRAWTSQSIRVCRVAITATGPACLVDISLPHGLLVTSGRHRINSLSHSTMRIRLKRLVASLNVVCVETTAQRFPNWGAAKSDSGKAKDEFGFEVGRLETSITVVLRKRFSDWARDQARQEKYLSKNDASSKRLANERLEWDGDSESDSESGDKAFFNGSDGEAEGSDELTFVTASSQGYDFSDDASFVTASDGGDVALDDPSLAGLDRQASSRSMLQQQGSFRSKSTGPSAKPAGGEDSSKPKRGVTSERSMADVPFAFIARRGIVRTVMPMGSQPIEYASLEGREPVKLCMISNPDMLREVRAGSSFAWSNPETPRSAGQTAGVSPVASVNSATEHPQLPSHLRSGSMHSAGQLNSGSDAEVTHTVEIGVHGLVVQMSPLSLDALSAMVQSVPPLSRTAEGCVDLLSALNPREAMSNAFAGSHKVVKVLRLKASFAELQLLQRLPPDGLSSREPKNSGPGSELEDGGEMSILNVAAKGVQIEKMDSKMVQGPKVSLKQRRGSEVRMSMMFIREQTLGSTAGPARQSQASVLSALAADNGLLSMESELAFQDAGASRNRENSSWAMKRAGSGRLRDFAGSRDDLSGRRGVGFDNPEVSGRRKLRSIEGNSNLRKEGEGDEERGKSGEFNVVLEGFLLWVCRLPDWRGGGRETGDRGSGCGLGFEAMEQMLRDSPFVSKPPSNMDVIAIAHGHRLVAKFRADDFSHASEQGRTAGAAGVRDSMPQAAKLMGTTSSHMLVSLKVDPVSVLVCTAAAALLGPSAFLWMEVNHKLQSHVDRRKKVVQRNVRMIYDLVANQEDEGGVQASYAITRKLAMLSVATYKPKWSNLAPTAKLRANQELRLARFSLLGGESSVSGGSSQERFRRKRTAGHGRLSNQHRLSREDVGSDGDSVGSRRRRGSLTFQMSREEHEDGANEESQRDPHGQEEERREEERRGAERRKTDRNIKWTHEAIRELAIAVAGSKDSALSWLDNRLQLPFDALDAENESGAAKNPSEEGGWRLDVVATVGEIMVHFVPTEEEDDQPADVLYDAEAPGSCFGSGASSVCLSPSHITLVATNLRRTCPSNGEPISEIGGVVRCEKCRVMVRPPFIGLVSEAAKGFSNLAKQQAKDLIQSRRELVGAVDMLKRKGKGRAHPVQSRDAEIVKLQAEAKAGRRLRLSRNNSIQELSREEAGWFERQRRLSECASSGGSPAIMPSLGGTVPGLAGPGAAKAPPPTTSAALADAVPAPPPSRPTMMHLQVEVGIDVDALVPTGKVALSVGSCITSYTQTPRSLAKEGRVAPGDQSTVCVSVNNVDIKAVPAGSEDDCPQVTVAEVQVNYMSTAECPALKSGNEGSTVKDLVHRSKHTFSSLLVQIDGVVAQVNLPKVDASSLGDLLSPWLQEVRNSEKPAAEPARNGQDATLAEVDFVPVHHIRTVITTVRGVTVHLQVLPWVHVHYENSWGLYLDFSHYTFSSDATTDTPLPPPAVSFSHSFTSGHSGPAVRNSSELSFKLHQSRIWSEKEGDAKLSKNELYLPELRGHGKMQSKSYGKESGKAKSTVRGVLSENKDKETKPAADFGDSIKEEEIPEQVSDVLGEVAKELERKLEDFVEEELEHVTKFEMMLYMNEMVNEVNEAMLNSLLELQRTMTSEINMMLKNAEKHLAKRKQDKQAKEEKAEDDMAAMLKAPIAPKAPAKEFCLYFLLQGFRLRALAPTTALLLDTGFVNVKVSGIPKEKRKEQVDLSWNVILKGLSLVATSPYESPNVAFSRAADKTWVLAQLMTDISLEYSNLDFVAVNPSPGDDQNKFRLLLANNKALAHPGFLHWAEAMVKHYSEAFAKYKKQRQHMNLQGMDRNISSLQKKLLRKGTTAVKGSMPELPRLEILIDDTSASLFFDAIVPERFCHHLPSKAEDMFKSIKLGQIELAEHLADDRALVVTVGRICLDVLPSIQTKAVVLNMSYPPINKGSTRGSLQVSNFCVCFSTDGNGTGAEPAQSSGRFANGEAAFRGLAIESIQGLWHGIVRDGDASKTVNAVLQLTVPSLDIAVEASTVSSFLAFATRWGGKGKPAATAASDAKGQVASVVQVMKARRLSFSENANAATPTATALLEHNASSQPETHNGSGQPAHAGGSNNEQTRPKVTLIHPEVLFELSRGSVKVFGRGAMEDGMDETISKSINKSPRTGEKGSRGSHGQHASKVLLELPLPRVTVAGSLNLLHHPGPAEREGGYDTLF